MAMLITSKGGGCNDTAKCHNFRWVFLEFLFLDFSKLMRLSFYVSKRDNFQTFLVGRKKPVNMNPKSSNRKREVKYIRLTIFHDIQTCFESFWSVLECCALRVL